MKYRLVRVALLFLSVWYTSCSSSPQQSGDEQPVEQATAKAGEQPAPQEAEVVPADSDLLPVGDSPMMGKASAPVTVVMFSDLQCPYSSRGVQTMRQLVEKYPDQVRVVVKHYPLPFHKEAPGASKAAIAAGNQGKFWEMHDWLFENQMQLKSHASDMKEWTAGYAEELGLDVELFRADYDAAATAGLIEDDMALGRKLQVRGTPHFFINGVRLQGARPQVEFERIINEQIEEVDNALAAGVDREELYRTLVAENYETPEARNRPSKPSPTVEYVPVEADDPMLGNTKDPLVTIVEFSDFQCPFCSKAVPTLKKIANEYPDQVRIVFKQLPLGMHPQAKPAARAALAAHKQGKFWEMHDLLFDRQSEMRSNNHDFKGWSVGLAKELGLDVDQFEKDYSDPKTAKRIEDDAALSQEIGVRGTPNFWINGVNIRGAQPFPAFKAEIDKQIELAKKIKKEKGLSGDALYKAVASENKEHADLR